MIIHTEFSVALYCPVCGSVCVSHVDRFMPKRALWQDIRCHCGEIVARIRHMRRTVWLVMMMCVGCNQEHVFLIDSRHFYDNVGMERVACEDCSLEAGVCGSPGQVDRFVQQRRREHQLLLQTVGETVDPNVLLAGYNRLYDMIARQAITCACEQPDIVVQICRDSLVLSCRHCGSSISLAAQTAGDILSLKERQNITLTRTGLPG